jgi:1-acyl-sn-glycerol-3-phosphate acyltransferase
MRFGAPLDFSRYDSARGDRFVERAITDEIMYELMVLSGRPYVDVYASKLKTTVEPPAPMRLPSQLDAGAPADR